MELLVISHVAPYDGVRTAGEKTHNYYLKAFADDKDMNVRIISIISEQDYPKLDYEKYGIQYNVLVERNDKISETGRKFHRAMKALFQPKDKFANFVLDKRIRYYKRTISELKSEGYVPDCIILEFTQSILLVDIVKDCYPGTPVIASSYDVSYVGSYRMLMNENRLIARFFRKRQYKNLKQREIEALSKCDLIVPQNINDINIFRSEKELADKEFFRLVPYYDDYSDVKRSAQPYNMIFFGSMGRKENSRSVIWFIENVFKHLDEKWKLTVMGGNPPEELMKYESDSIHITGFLDEADIKKHFSECTFMVVPLILGSGIKVKILEAFSGNVPVVTNDIGNEGIFAEDGKGIIFCGDKDEFIKKINEIADGKYDLDEMASNASMFLNENFNLEKCKTNYIHRIKGFLNDKFAG